MMTASSMRLTPESKAQLRTTVRGLRESLIRELRTSVEQTYLRQLPTAKAAPRLSSKRRERRRRLDEALAQRAQEDGGTSEARERALLDAVKETGATLLNRLVLIRHLEAMGLSKPAVVTGGWKSPGYVEFREFAGALCEDETQGYGALLQLVFDELAQVLPGLFGNVGFTKLIPVPPETLRELVEALDSLPAEAWRDDMTLGWVYQYWNDSDREALDAKLNEGDKVAHHEIASKTQMFTERYMVEWLLQNSLGPTWLAMCRKNGWRAEVEAKGVLSSLEARRAEWRKKRDAGQVEPDALMAISGPLEEAWKYYVPQPLTDETVKQAPESLQRLKLLDPACGSGHFLVVAFDLLVELYREEARHRGLLWSDRQIAEWILEDNLHGVDIDPRAVQIAAAAIFLKAKTLAREATPGQVNLVAPALRLSSLSKDDPALVRFERDILAETGLPPQLTGQIIQVLEGVDYLGSLLKVGDAVDRAIEAHQGALGRVSSQSDLFVASGPSKVIPVTRSNAKKAVLDRLNAFLSTHAGEEDLGLRLRGQQLAAGVRFAGIVKEGQFDVIVGNPPYQSTSKMQDAGYVATHYPKGKSDLYAAFLERGLALCRPGGVSAMVTMQSWMFLGHFEQLRKLVLTTSSIRAIADLGTGAFGEISGAVVSAAMTVLAREVGVNRGTGLRLAACGEGAGPARSMAKRAALLVQDMACHFDQDDLSTVSGCPIVFWWPAESFKTYEQSQKLGDVYPVRFGAITSDNVRFTRKRWEISPSSVLLSAENLQPVQTAQWVPFILGSPGKWIDPCDDICLWARHGLELKTYNQLLYGSYTRKIQNERYYFRRGVAFTMIGREFAARVHRFVGVIADKGSSVFASDLADAVCSMNRTQSRQILSDLNPTISFQVGDVNRLPLVHVDSSSEIFGNLERAFGQHCAGNELSPDFRRPEGSPWSAAVTWADRAVDRPSPSPLEPFKPTVAPPTPLSYVTFAFGVAAGRFDGSGKGILSAPTPLALRDGIVVLTAATGHDSLSYPACDQLHAAWAEHGASISEGNDLRAWLQTEFFKHHRAMYKNRPIYFPLASSKRSFVAFISIHRWSDSTLSALLADHLIPDRKAIEGVLADLQVERTSTDKKARAAAEKRYVQHKRWLEELEEFIALVRQCAEKGPPPSDDKTPPREVDAPYCMELDDGVMVNSAALWPLLEPLWKDPKKWWKELATAQGRKDYDWSHLAGRYFPDRVDKKCRKDPSLAVAHGCFWRYHPERAYQWELRLQEEISPDFHIDDSDSSDLRAAFLKKNAKMARELESAEQARRDRKAKQQDHDELDLAEAEDGAEDEEAEDLSA